jgi:hypothetical protein
MPQGPHSEVNSSTSVWIAPQAFELQTWQRAYPALDKPLPKRNAAEAQWFAIGFKRT